MAYRFRSIAAAGLIAAGLQGAAAQEFGLLSAPFGSGSYVLGGALEQIVNTRGDGIRISHSESPGFAFNHIQLEREPELRETMIIGSGRGVATLAVRGEPPFDSELPQVMALANYNLGSNFLATLDSSIDSIADLAGRRVALGRPPQINWTIQPEWLIRVGWELGDEVNIQYLGVQEAVTALLDGQVDAAIVGGYFDPLTERMELSPQTAELLASGRTLKFLPWGTERVERTDEAGMPMVPISIPASALPNTEEPLEGFADTISWTVSEEFPEEAAYQITKLIIENLEQFAEFHALGRLMSPDAIVYGWEPEEFHPGALRAYREAGILD